MRKLRVLDLFSGLGGFSLGLERTGGFQTVAFCEPEPYCRTVLERHWPGVARFKDVRYLTREKLKPFLPIHVICGGFPCQDVSIAGDGAGLDGARSGLYSEHIRLIGEFRPDYALMENVAALLVRGLGRLLGELAEIGYDAEWNCIPASALGAPHRRDRVWILAYPKRKRGEGPIASPDIGQPGPWGWRGQEDLRALADAPFIGGDRWPAPLIRRMDARLRYRVHRLRALGNSVCPYITEAIGKAILQAEAANY